MLAPPSICILILVLTASAGADHLPRRVRYVEWSPPVVHPQVDQVTVQARQDYTLSCEGHKPVSWHTPADYDNSDRVTITHASDSNSKNRFVSHLEIRHMVYTDTGSYVCSFNGSQDLQSIDSATRIHIYVFDEIHLLTHGGFDFQQSVQYETAEIPCRPTHPNVSMSLTLQGRGPVHIDNKYITYSPKVGYLISPVLAEHSGQYWCTASYKGRESEYGVSLNVLMQTSYVPPPHINKTSGSHVTMGETLILTCSVSINWNIMVDLSWKLPNKFARSPRLLLPDPVSRNVSIGGSYLKVVEQKLQLHRVDKEDQGNYECIVTDHSNNNQSRREFIRIYQRDQSFLKVWQDGFNTLHKSAGKDESVQWVVEIASHPPPRVTWYDPDGNIIKDGEDKVRGRVVHTALSIKNTRSMLKLSKLKLTDSGDYSIKVENDFHVKWENFSLEVTDKPKIELSVVEQADKGLYQVGRPYTLQCTATGYPLPKISWTFKRCKSYNKCEDHKEHYSSTLEATNGKFQMDATLKTVAADSGVFTCMACNGGDINCEISQVNFFVTTLPEGFHISGPTRAIEGDTVELDCAVSKYNYTDSSLVWYKQTTSGYKEVQSFKDFKYRRTDRRNGFSQNNNNPLQVIDSSPSKFDIGKRLRFQNIEPEDSGVYVCQAKLQGPVRRHNLDSTTIVEKQIELRVQGLRSPEIFDSMNMNKDPIFIKDGGETVELRCKARGYPTPKVKWYLNDSLIDFESHPNFLTFDDGQSLRIAAVVAKKNEGKYTCKATSRAGQAVLHQVIQKVEAPEIFKTDMFGSDQIIDNLVDKVVEAGTVMNLTCEATGKPAPNIYWTFNNSPVNDSVVKYANHNCTMIIENFQSQHAGKYDCIVHNLGGTVTRFQWVKLSETQQRASIYGADIAIPVFIAVGAVIILAIICLAIAKVCLTTGRWNKAPPTPPTPRLTQFDMPDQDIHDHETESCRLTLSRDGSPYGQAVCHGCRGCSGECHQCSQCHYNYNGLYGCTTSGSGMGLMSSYHHGGSIIGVLPSHTPVPRIPSPNTTLLGEFHTYSQHTLPINRMNTLGRESMSRMNTLGRGFMPPQTDESRRSASPRISADF